MESSSKVEALELLEATDALPFVAVARFAASIYRPRLCATQILFGLDLSRSRALTKILTEPVKGGSSMENKH